MGDSSLYNAQSSPFPKSFVVTAPSVCSGSRVQINKGFSPRRSVQWPAVTTTSLLRIVPVQRCSCDRNRPTNEQSWENKNDPHLKVIGFKLMTLD